MASFPDRFQEPLILGPLAGARGGEALSRLNGRGYDVAVGLDEYYADAVGVMSRQAYIAEYCPRDATPERFASLASSARWLKKNGGRAVFLFLERFTAVGGVDHQLAGYGWSGLADPAAAENFPVTTSFRLGEGHSGRGLGGDFIQTVVSATHEMFAGGEGIGLETWQSNPAVRLYRELGFVVLEEASGQRPSLRPDAVDGHLPDVRLRMGYRERLD